MLHRLSGILNKKKIVTFMNVERRQGRKVSILVVEPSSRHQLEATKALTQAGFEVSECHDGPGALAWVRACPPALVFMNVAMPGLGGFELCARIRELPGGTHLPILMMTDADDVDAIDRAYEAGATDFLTKPLNAHILIHRVRYLLRAQQVADELRESENLLGHAQRLAKLGSWHWDVASGVVSRSAVAVRLIGGQEPKSFAEALAELLPRVHKKDRELVRDTYQRVLTSGESRAIEYRVLTNGEPDRFLHEALDAEVDANGKVTRLLGTVQDITDRRRAEERIRHLAYYDSVTGLPNRAMLKEQVRRALAGARRHNRLAALLFLDLDHFKRVNDTLGHSAGDELLREVATRLANSVRDSDYVAHQRREVSAPGSNTDTGCPSVARLGGDEFVILLSEVRKPEDAASVAERAIESLRAPIRLGDNDIYVTGSIGISTFPEDGDSDEALLKHADAAMYHAKDLGRNRYQFYTKSINERALARIELESSLRKAIEAEEFELYYQPQINIQDGRVVGAEALIRWHSPERGFVPPDQFISVAEDSGLLIPIGEWVLGEACRQNQRWREQGLPELSVAVNISAVQCAHAAFSETVEHSLAASGLDPQGLDLEVTESLLMQNLDTSVQLLEHLKRFGCRVSIDDFGTGYSSLSYLKRLPLNAIKIDRSFINELTENSDDANIVEATISLCHNLRLKVLAEGVEEQAQLEYLRARGCDEAQGYFFSKPLPAAEFETWLDAHRDGCKVDYGYDGLSVCSTGSTATA